MRSHSDGARPWQTIRQVEYALVPKLSLQPLVENAIHHGVGPLEQLGQIRIGIYRQDTGKLMLEVADNGIGMEESRRQQMTRTRPGIGLSNLKERLRLLFKGQSELEVIDTKPGTSSSCLRSILIV